MGRLLTSPTRYRGEHEEDEDPKHAHGGCLRVSFDRSSGRRFSCKAHTRLQLQYR